MNFYKKKQNGQNEQRLKVYIDASPAIDLFPKLRLVNNSVTDFNESFDDLQKLSQKVKIYTVTDLIISLHKTPENDITYLATLQQFKQNITQLGTDSHC